MKNKLLVSIGFLLVFSAGYSQVEKFKIFEVETKGIKVQINPNLELFHIMAYLGNSDYLNNYDFKYKSDINSFFAPHKSDNAIQFVKKVLQNYNAGVSIDGLFYDNNFKKDTSFMKYLQLDNFGLPNTLRNKTIVMDSLIRAVVSFSEITRFGKFIDSHQAYYKEKIDEVANEISKIDIVNDFESFWGTKKDSYKIVITLLEKEIHASWFISNNKSQCLFYLTPKFVIDKDAKFGNSDITNLREGKMSTKDYIYYGATHEIGHTFLNPIMDNYVNEIDRISFKIITSDPSKITFLCESILRSLTAYFLIKNQYDEFAQMVIQGEKQQGYIYNDIIVDLIKEYSCNRNKYKSFNDYVPELLIRLYGQVE